MNESGNHPFVVGALAAAGAFLAAGAPADTQKNAINSLVNNAITAPFLMIRPPDASIEYHPERKDDDKDARAAAAESSHQKPEYSPAVVAYAASTSCWKHQSVTKDRLVLSSVSDRTENGTNIYATPMEFTHHFGPYRDPLNPADQANYEDKYAIAVRSVGYARIEQPKQQPVKGLEDVWVTGYYVNEQGKYAVGFGGKLPAGADVGTDYASTVVEYQKKLICNQQLEFSVNVKDIMNLSGTDPLGTNIGIVQTEASMPVLTGFFSENQLEVKARLLYLAPSYAKYSVDGALGARYRVSNFASLEATAFYGYTPGQHHHGGGVSLIAGW